MREWYDDAGSCLRGYTKSEPGAVATGSRRCTIGSFFPTRPDFVMTGVVEHLGNDPVATAPGSDFV